MAYPQLFVTLYQLFSYALSPSCSVSGSYRIISPLLIFPIHSCINCRKHCTASFSASSFLVIIHAFHSYTSSENGISLSPCSFMSSKTKSTVTDMPLFSPSPSYGTNWIHWSEMRYPVGTRLLHISSWSDDKLQTDCFQYIAACFSDLQLSHFPVHLTDPVHLPEA